MEAKDGSLIGFEVDLAELLAESMNIKLDIVRMPFKDLMPSLEKGSIDAIISGMTITMSRNARVAFVGPYMLSEDRRLPTPLQPGPQTSKLLNTAPGHRPRICSM